MAFAEQKKLDVLHGIEDMRKQFKMLVKQNSTLPKYLQLHKKVVRYC
jgi:hypothetical protein